MTNNERRQKINKINNLIFEIEESYPYSRTEPHYIRLQLYRTRVELGRVERQIIKEEESYV